MKQTLKITLVLCGIGLLFQQAIAQESIDEIKHKEQLLKYEELMWENSESSFKDTEVPIQWENESKVGLCKSYKLVLENRYRRLYYNYYYHERIKLQDNSALKEYSEFSFNDSYKSKGLFKKVIANRFVGFKVVKPDGTEFKVNVDNAVDVSIQQGRRSDSYNKVAIPGLEVGDIIDFFYINEVKLPLSGYSFYDFNPDYYLTRVSYPIKKQYFKLQTSKNIYVNARSVNGAPKLQLISKDDDFKTYAFEDSMCVKVINNEYVNGANSLPHIKMQVFYSQSPTKPYTFLAYSSMLGDRVDFKGHLDIQDLAELSKSFSVSISKYYYATLRYIRDNYNKKTSSKAEVAKDAYYFLREYNLHVFLLRAASNQNIFSEIYEKPLNNVSSIRVLAALFVKWKVPFQMVYTVPNSISRMEDWLFVDELAPMIKVCAEDTFLISRFSFNSLIDELPQRYSGNDGYSVKFIEKKGGVVNYDNKVRPFKFHKNSAHQMQSVITIDANIKNFEDATSITYNYNVEGVHKAEWDSLVVSSFDKYNDSNVKYNNYYFGRQVYTSSLKKALNNLENQQADFEKESAEKIEKLFQERLGLEALKFDSLNVINIGRWEENPNLDFNLNFSLSDACTDVGNGYLFPVGALIGNMLQPNLEDTIQYDFKTSGPYVHKQELYLTIPKKYSIPDIGELKMDFENACGGIHLNAHVKSDTLLVEVREILNDQFFSKDLWPDYKALKDTIKTIGYHQLFIEKDE